MSAIFVSSLVEFFVQGPLMMVWWWFEQVMIAERNDNNVPVKYKHYCTSRTTARLHVSTLIIGHLQAFLQLSLQILCMFGSHRV